MQLKIGSQKKKKALRNLAQTIFAKSVHDAVRICIYIIIYIYTYHLYLVGGLTILIKYYSSQ